MADKVEYSRLLIKRTNQSGTIPTIPPGGAGLTTFTPTDTFIGEFFLNQVDDSLWIRTSNGQIPILLSGSTPGGSGNCITDLYITNLYGCSPITLHDDFEVITNKLFRNQSGGVYDNTLSFGNSLFQDLIRLRAEDTSSGNESELRLRTNDGLGNAGLTGGVIGPNAAMNFGLTTDPNPSTFMSKQDLSNNFASSYDVAGYSQSIKSTDNNLNAEFFILDMTTPATSYIGCRYDDLTTNLFSLQKQNSENYELIIENPTDWQIRDYKYYDGVNDLIQQVIKTESISQGHYAQILVDSKTTTAGSNISMLSTDGQIEAISQVASNMKSYGSSGIFGDIGALNSNVQATTLGISIDPGIGGEIQTSNIAAYDDDAAAGIGGLTTGMIYQTTGAGAAPLNAAGILMVKQ